MGNSSQKTEACVKKAKTAISNILPVNFEGDMATCCICKEKPSKIINLPCFHLCLCQDCSDTLNSKNSRRCPICEADIVEFKMVYMC